MGMPDLGARLAHLGVLVRRIGTAAGVYRRLGLRQGETETFAQEGVRMVFLGVGGARIELLEPITASGALQRFLEQRGEGVHHVALEVPDIHAALDRARRAGASFIGVAPRAGARGTRVAFVHPASAHGVLIELVEVLRPLASA